MSKKPVPKQKQAVSSTRARHATWVRKARTKMENKCVLEDCKSCGEKKRMHFVCEECGVYNGKQVFDKKEKTSAEPIQEIEA
ncbi:MAG: 50S ribosomal protein L32 [Candidatus Peregrinibacteria bacterium]|nr:50S ribosomal protein L32 [Candidatus Peregrinibacteria bacterium]